MLRLLLIAIALCGLGVSASCKRSLTNYIYTGNGYKVDCMGTQTYVDMVRCLLQANGVSKMLECGHDYPREIISFPASKVPADTMDMANLINPPDDIFDIPSDYMSAADGLFRFRPRHLLSQAFLFCENCHQCRARKQTPSGPIDIVETIDTVGSLFQLCPINDWRKFLDCLCCTKMKPCHLENLEAFVRGVTFGYPDLNQMQPYQILWPLADYRCPKKCKYGGREGDNGGSINQNGGSNDEPDGGITDDETATVWFPEPVDDETSYDVVTPSTSYLSLTKATTTLEEGTQTVTDSPSTTVMGEGPDSTEATDDADDTGSGNRVAICVKMLALISLPYIVNTMV